MRSVIETLPPRPKIRILSWHIAPSVVISGWISDVFISSSTALHKTLKIEMCILIFAILFTYKRMLILFLSVSYHLRSHPFFILFLSVCYPLTIPSFFRQGRDCDRSKQNKMFSITSKALIFIYRVKCCLAASRSKSILYIYKYIYIIHIYI